MRKKHAVLKLLQDPLFPIKSQWKLQVAIATKVLVRLTKCINVHNLHLNIFPFIKLHKKKALFKLSHDPVNGTERQADIATKFIVDEQNSRQA